MADIVFWALWGTATLLGVGALIEFAIYCTTESLIDKPIPRHPILWNVMVLCIIGMVIMFLLRVFGVVEFGP